MERVSASLLGICTLFVQIGFPHPSALHPGVQVVETSVDALRLPTSLAEDDVNPRQPPAKG
jgi:hypothetical protein